MLHYHRIEKDAWLFNRALTGLALCSFIALLICLFGLLVDHRLINGELGWIKPAKFSTSFLIYAVSMIWLSQFIKQWRAIFRLASMAACWGALIELAAIILQVLRGTTSHFNAGTLFDHVVFVVVKIAILPVALSILVSLILLMRQKNLPPVIDVALHWGVFLTLVGCLPAVLMVLPDPLQDAITRYAELNGHAVGLPEGGPGLPFLGWSTIGGDLRVAHFVGIHALQILPIAGILIARFLPRLSQQRQSFLVSNLGITYLGLIALLTFQALRAEPIVVPSKETIAFLAFLLSTNAAATFVIFTLPNRGGRKTDSLRAVETIS
jgi:hypothetical protein